MIHYFSRFFRFSWACIYLFFMTSKAVILSGASWRVVFKFKGRNFKSKGRSFRFKGRNFKSKGRSLDLKVVTSDLLWRTWMHLHLCDTIKYTEWWLLHWSFGKEHWWSNYLYHPNKCWKSKQLQYTVLFLRHYTLTWACWSSIYQKFCRYCGSCGLHPLASNNHFCSINRKRWARTVGKKWTELNRCIWPVQVNVMVSCWLYILKVITSYEHE